MDLNNSTVTLDTVTIKNIGKASYCFDALQSTIVLTGCTIKGFRLSVYLNGGCECTIDSTFIHEYAGNALNLRLLNNNVTILKNSNLTKDGTSSDSTNINFGNGSSKVIQENSMANANISANTSVFGKGDYIVNNT